MRFTTGDAMSKRSKFALITWIGENVSGLQRAKTGTDKALVKEAVQVAGLAFFPRRGGVTPDTGPPSRGTEQAGVGSWDSEQAVWRQSHWRNVTRAACRVRAQGSTTI